MSDKTEPPSGKRLEHAREEGRVVRSVELNTALALLGGTLLLTGPGRSLVSACKDELVSTLAIMPNVSVTDEWLRQLVFNTAMRFLTPLGAILVGMLAIGVSVTLLQTNFLWSSKKMGVDLNRLNPITGFSHLFSGQGLIELARAILKVTVVGYGAYGFLKSRYTELLLLSQTDLASGLQHWIDLAVALAIRIGSIYLVLAIADYVFQRWQFMRSMRMTKEEVKQEYRQTEGDPLLKGRIRREQRRIARSRMMANVHKATVVVVNPTHLAVAIEYTPEMRAPRILAKGAYKIAEQIVAIAKENYIPVVQNIPLARALFKNVAIDQEIPPEFYLAMAEVLAYVFRMRTPHTAPLQTQSE